MSSLLLDEERVEQCEIGDFEPDAVHTVSSGGDDFDALGQTPYGCPPEVAANRFARCRSYDQLNRPRNDDSA